MTPARTPTTIALTIGDPNGIGPEIAIQAARACANDGVAGRVFLVGDPAVIRHYARRDAGAFAIREFRDAFPPPDPHAIDVLAVETPAGAAFAPGVVDRRAGAATLRYVEAALAAVRGGIAGAIVAGPHSETAVNAAGIAFRGYPAFIADCQGVPRDRVFLLLIGGGLRIVHATLHERLADALARLDAPLIEAAARALIAALQTLGVAAPRIGVFGINPHAGEGGLFGDDDEAISIPAVARLRAAGWDVDGPAGADVMLGRDDLDAFVAMYHDQGHIPVKLRAGRTASALTIGAGILFASVGHGSAFDIAGAGIADASAICATLARLRVSSSHEVAV